MKKRKITQRCLLTLKQMACSCKPCAIVAAFTSFLLVSFICPSSFLFFGNTFPIRAHVVKPIVTVDITGMVRATIKQITAAHLPPASAKRAIRHFATALEHAVTVMSQHDQVVVLPREAVIAGAQDRTERLWKQLSQENKENNKKKQDAPRAP